MLLLSKWEITGVR